MKHLNGICYTTKYSMSLTVRHKRVLRRQLLLKNGNNN